ncbi:23S rRNA (adenine(2030)-N(6))-methyltransferase RlmJ [Roseomonas xinghualingensis]|uniref:23S rRNA (adenine(2030)-N(6))-methyltransferase RlmJ n=1 Tax=Roseomonas xinghualingensis TaxID=2986475 RepID=UPI0021F1D136|nr:23S rRNA (adenine(2030)-N(6))-methyltransferase RlmJ [Roseomonas sp. SXEYE001]MCV4207612.1 23S rRNA (adenine(2030)-N(6))-methyltransferase RlmJ [Roseomonas sp. SXEYE001]
MNYRHAFHAANFADCMKHALVHALATALLRKATPFRVLDTHAGIGLYDLQSNEARRTGEWRDGIGRLETVQDGPLLPWLTLVRSFPRGTYPGSPALLRAMLRAPEQANDHLALCELHPEDHATLRAAFRGDGQVSVHWRDAYEALTALTPFPERRGLVLMDPPFEAEGEFGRMAEGMAGLSRRFRGAIQAAWYPVKHRAPVRAFHDALAGSGIRDVIACEIWLREPTDPTRLNGCGLAVVNPPFGFPGTARDILAALHARFDDGEAGAGWSVTEVVPE